MIERGVRARERARGEREQEDFSTNLDLKMTHYA